mgnify:CR=1 FL=1
MGEYADQIINGECCALCMAPFVTEQNIDGADVPVVYEHGYPVACESCWELGCGYEKAEVGTL